ncbi:MAG TPA: replication-relaxation family protein [Streptosporangiaceae bacterium]|nr:replication-relaxation family protein [Streptosporangiaceae bacterium]
MASHSYARGAGAGRKDSEDCAVLAAAAHLTERDRYLVRLVGEHRVLTTGQLCALGFGSIVTARHRLAVLVRIGMLRRFRPHPETGSAPWHYLLGPVGGALLGAEDRDEKKWVPQVRADRQLALERSQRLGHMTGRNWFFVALAVHARAGGGELREWLNETQAASRYQGRVFVAPGDWDRLPSPDGLGTWAEPGREVTFWLEYDTGIMDTSLLYHPALAPAVNPDWRIVGTYLAIGCVATLTGGWRFTQRDLQSS